MWQPPDGPPAGAPAPVGDVADRPLGPGWWQASDLRWYPPHLRPGAPPPMPMGLPTAYQPPVPPAAVRAPVTAPAASPLVRRGVLVAAAVVLLLAILAGVLVGALSDDDRIAQDPDVTTSSPMVPTSSVPSLPSAPLTTPEELVPARPGGLVIYHDTFDDPASGWIPVDVTDGDSYRYEDGKLVITPDGVAEIAMPFHSMPGAVEVEMTTGPIEGGAVLECMYRQPDDHADVTTIVFAVLPDGSFEAYLTTPDGVTEPMGRGVVTLQPTNVISILCDETAGIQGIVVTPTVNGEPLPALAAPTAHDGPRWMPVVGATEGASLQIDDIVVRDPRRIEVERPPVEARGGEVTVDEALVGEEIRAWAPERASGRVEAYESAEGLTLTSTSQNRFGLPSVYAFESGGIEVAATAVVHADAEVGSGAGVGCSQVLGGTEWAYGFTVAPNGAYLLDRNDDVAGATYWYALRYGSTEVPPPGPLGAQEIRLVCLAGVDGNGRWVVRLVGFIGDRLVVDVVDSTPTLDGVWRPMVAVSRTELDRTTSTFSHVEVRTRP